MVYPHHGAGKVLKKEQKEVLGEKREYLTIKILHNDMTVMVPCENAGKAGLRRVIGEEAVEKVLAVLRDDVSQMPKNWNRRFKHNREKIKTGDVYELAEVVRNLAIRESEKGLSTGEKQMYTRAKKILASELMYALEMEEDEAEEHLDSLIAGRARRTAMARPSLHSGVAGSSPPAAAASASGPMGPRRSSTVPAGRWSTGASSVLADGLRPGGGRGAGGMHEQDADGRVAGRRRRLALGVGAQRAARRVPEADDRRRPRRRAAAADARARRALRRRDPCAGGATARSPRRR